jgi:uncharacterized protein YlxW (UPF0749 family)
VWEFVSQPPVFGAICVLLGVLVTQWTAGSSKRQDRVTELLMGSLNRLQAEVDGLRTELNALKVELAEAKSENSLLARKLRAALDWTRALLAWGDEAASMVDAGTDVPVAPGVPKVLEEDY